MYVDNPALLAEIRSHTQPAPVVQIFDEVWYVGFENVGAHIFKVNGGWVTIDTLNRTSDIDTYMVPALQALGLASAPLRGVYLTHGHFDHDGGASRLRALYGAGVPIYLGSADAVGNSAVGAAKTYSPIPIDSNNFGYQAHHPWWRPDDRYFIAGAHTGDRVGLHYSA
jgi:glyoxylase-like metal-dependent hydrolase (beta-lactamase superfamily II)